MIKNVNIFRIITKQFSLIYAQANDMMDVRKFNIYPHSSDQRNCESTWQTPLILSLQAIFESVILSLHSAIFAPKQFVLWNDSFQFTSIANTWFYIFY